MILYNYNNFLLESDDKDKTYFLILSDKFKKLLSNIDSPISKKILSFIKDGEKSSISFLDYIDDDKDKIDKITFFPINKFLQNPENLLKVINGPIPEEIWKSKQRQEMSVGKIVNKLFPDEFKQTEIENFVNSFKAAVSKTFADFKLVEGEEIRYWYLDEHYESKTMGDINQSCMKEQKSQKYLDIYVKNPEKCKLLVLMSEKENKKSRGRALIWIGLRKPTGKIYMDRIYTIYQADVKMYIDYAIKNGWLYKNTQGMYDASYIEDGKVFRSSVSIQLNPIEFDLYPSLDTLSYYTPSTGRLASNSGNYILGHPRYRLNGVDGKAQKLDK
jgi:hypothetical protein